MTLRVVKANPGSFDGGEGGKKAEKDVGNGGCPLRDARVPQIDGGQKGRFGWSGDRLNDVVLRSVDYQGENLKVGTTIDKVSQTA